MPSPSLELKRDRYLVGTGRFSSLYQLQGTVTTAPLRRLSLLIGDGLIDGTGVAPLACSGATRYGFNPAVQFTTTAIGADAGCPSAVLIRNRCPSAVAAYW